MIHPREKCVPPLVARAPPVSSQTCIERKMTFGEEFGDDTFDDVDVVGASFGDDADKNTGINYEVGYDDAGKELKSSLVEVVEEEEGGDDDEFHGGGSTDTS